MLFQIRFIQNDYHDDDDDDGGGGSDKWQDDDGVDALQSHSVKSESKSKSLFSAYSFIMKMAKSVFSLLFFLFALLLCRCFLFIFS